MAGREVIFGVSAVNPTSDSKLAHQFRRDVMASNEDVAEQLRGIEQGLAVAWVNLDREFIERILADDWTVIDPSGRILTKSQVLEEAFVSEDRQVTSATIDDVSVRLFGDWALVTGRSHAVGQYEGEHIEISLRFTDVFVRQSDAEWKVVASQATPIHE
jgi:ketosteroid isomerase-like protein